MGGIEEDPSGDGSDACGKAFAAAGSPGSFSLRTVWDLKPDRIRPPLGLAVWASARTERAVAGLRRLLKLNLACAACRPLPFFSSRLKKDGVGRTDDVGV